ncbi:DUF1674 domain-containing protein [Sphingorhabdus sp. Alg239-R122]|uniref:DUF1674 domain-containing protein n=1 Tax=Sphingorhabdus sp. Alg239-R122 TaxID=2305989 RepID=UPI001F086E85|nr:DUF1674 domain-containing protein [Sphingorhabdus sp. Alg239-R122]
MADNMSGKIGETRRATKRPAHVKPPAHWKNAPAPEPQAEKNTKNSSEGRNPVRYGDWEINGVAIDF